MPNIRQSPGSLFQPPPSEEGKKDQNLAVFPPHPGKTSLVQNKMQLGPMSGVQESQLSSVPQNVLVNNQPSSIPFPQLSMQPRFPYTQQIQPGQILPQNTMPKPGVSTVPSVRPFAGLPIRTQTPVLETSTALKQQVQQLPMLQNRGPVGAANIGHNSQSVYPNATAQDLFLPRPLLSQPNFQVPNSTGTIDSVMTFLIK